MPNTRDLVFDRIQVDHLVRGSTRVSWGVFYQFLDPQPWTFTLQAGETGNPDADDWVDVGTPVVNSFFAADDVRRDFGTVRTLHYRVRLDTPLGTYYSKPAAAFGLLQMHDWLLAREIVRKELLRAGLALIEGWLLKRRRQHGTRPAEPESTDPRTMVVDPLTGDTLTRNRPAADATKGTDYVGGYYAPMPYSVDCPTMATMDGVDPEVAGNTNPDSASASARGLLVPYVSYADIFVARHSDLRYELGRVTVTGHQRGVPLVGDIQVRLIPFTDIVYTIAVPEG